ncbi:MULTISPECIES: FtsW/RodA/SpoVE family cell cycle protein [Actinomyces]|uniref:Probable peptidoglycan glycosyltransferase FtsW n=1 Tax=Actinomyces respiraculi TaxID=2744574 RepID=A0A7T0LM07_9ACTO|nr:MULTISPECIES: FtsW/RodA/SpoVE family cell cycle protein [Actinomyces]QPL06269.1 FtsW/RodA/SpoVE family cell cycle protein [Actinomyces respiraculi]
MAAGRPRVSEGPLTWLRRRLNASDGPLEGERTTLSYYALLITTLSLLTLGLIMVFSVQSVTVAADAAAQAAASGADAAVQEGSPFIFFWRYLAIAVAALVAMTLVSKTPIRWIKRLSIAMLGLAAIAQIFVFVPATRYCAGGNCNWVRIPIIGTFQPSELVKLGVSLYIGWVAAAKPHWLKGVRSVALRVLLPVGIAVGLVLGGGDLGTVVILVFVTAACLWLAGLGWGWFVSLGTVGALGFSVGTMLSANRRARIHAWLNPDGADPLDIGYQPTHGRYALGTGGLTGVGPGSSRQKWGYLTQADSDYIFAVLGEEFGFAGTLLTITLYLIVGWCCLRLMRRSNDLYVKVVTGGIMMWIVGQALVNMSVVVGLLPVLGVPLPLISAGGSSLVLVMVAVGVLLAFARHEPGAEEAFAARAGAVRRTLAVIAPRRRNRAS